MTFRPVRCPHCKRKLEPGQRLHPECIDGYAEAVEAKRQRAEAKRVRMAAKVARADIRARKEAIKPLPQLLKETQAEFNRWIRWRDRHQPCISCGRPLQTEAVGGGYDAGHYRSVGSAGHLRFNEQNVHAQCKQCNRHGAGRAVDYRIGLAARLGLAAVEALETDNHVHKWTKDEVRGIREEYRARNLQAAKEAT